MEQPMHKWKMLLFFALGMAFAAAFCMKWLENDFLVDGERFTILGLEWFYDAARLERVMGGLDSHVRALLRYHLYFDFAFMAGVFPGLAALCVLAAARTGSLMWKRLLLALAFLQLVAWACDISENNYLLTWIETGVDRGSLSLYYGVVATKWLLALSGLVAGAGVFLFSLRRKKI